MKSPLHILHLEDDPNDAALVQSTLEAGGITCAITCVQKYDDFVAALEHGGIDLLKPFAVDALLDTVKSPARDRESPWQLEPLPDWRSQSSAGGMRL